VRVLIDTAVILIMADDPRRLSRTAREVLRAGSTELHLSSVSIWEISAKCSSGKLELSMPLAAAADQWESDYGIKFIDFTVGDGLLEATLPRIHRDPFDRMLVCQALSRDLVIVTPDREIRGYDVPTIW
jgi:PIN domain nuclease of toxin-antitoxin system